MKKNHKREVLLSAFILVAALVASRVATAQDAKPPYPIMAPIEPIPR